MSFIPSMAETLCIFLVFLLPLCSCRPLSIEEFSSSKTFLIKLKGIDFIESTCKNTPNDQLCVSTLQSDPRSFDATEVDVLGLVIVDAIKSKATAAMEIIKNLRSSSSSNSGPDLGGPLFECSVQYNAILKADVPVAIEALTKGIPKFADHGMVDAAVEAQGCENGFQGSNSPLTDINQAVFDLSLVARSIIKMLL